MLDSGHQISQLIQSSWTIYLVVGWIQQVKTHLQCTITRQNKLEVNLAETQDFGQNLTEK